MKKFTLILLAFIYVATLSAQPTYWYDYANYKPDCESPLPGQTIEYSDTDFSFVVGFGASVAGPNVWGQFTRTVTFEFMDSDGTVLGSFDFPTSEISEYEEFELNNTHLGDLPPNSPIYVNMIVCYNYVNNEAGEIHELTLIENGNETCTGVFQEIGDPPLCCEVSRVLCFYTGEGGIVTEDTPEENESFSSNDIHSIKADHHKNYSNELTFKDISTSIHSVPTALTIHPNPTSATSQLTVENFIDESAIISMYSLEGKLMSTYTVQMEMGQNTLRQEIGQDLNNGIYLVQVLSENVNLTKKIMIQR